MVQNKIKKAYFAEKSAVVTGASSGIGKEIARILVQGFGMKVFGAARGKEKLEEAKAEIESQSFCGGSFVPCVLDVANKSAVESFAEKIKAESDDLALVISNAGRIAKFEDFLESDAEISKQILDVNLIGAMNMAKCFLPILSSKNSQTGFVIVGSSASVVPVPGALVYSSSKAGVKAFAEVLIAENQNPNLCISFVMPGMTNTGLFEAAGAELPRFAKKLMSRPERVAKSIVGAAKRKRKFKLIGADAKLMRFCYVVAPKSFLKFMRKILKKAKVIQ